MSKLQPATDALQTLLDAERRRWLSAFAEGIREAEANNPDGDLDDWIAASEAEHADALVADLSPDEPAAPENWPQAIRDRMAVVGLSQRSVAAANGMTEGGMSRLLNEGINTGWRKMAEVAASLGMELRAGRR